MIIDRMIPVTSAAERDMRDCAPIARTIGSCAVSASWKSWSSSNSKER